MNILFISTLSSNIASGLSWSVPARVKAQAKIDNCLWVNLSNVVMEHWNETRCFHNLKEFGEEIRLKILPEPFNHPDIIIFEGFYRPKHPKFAHELRQANVPYIIVPRSSLTREAQNNHSKWKKRIAHYFIFDKYVHNAAAIQYLTEDEFRDSGSMWNKNHIILPNGFSTPAVTKSSFNEKVIKAIFIGRFDIHQKGIDVLLEACNQMQGELRKAGFQLCLYGPRRCQYDTIKHAIENLHIDDFITVGGEITGYAKERCLLDSDLFVLTSRFEGHPMGLIEALAYGVPALVTPGSNMAKEIHDADAGWSCKNLSVEELMTMLRHIISEQNRLMDKSNNAKQLAKNYDWDKLAAKLHEEVERLLTSMS